MEGKRSKAKALAKSLKADYKEVSYPETPAPNCTHCGAPAGQKHSKRVRVVTDLDDTLTSPVIKLVNYHTFLCLRCEKHYAQPTPEVCVGATRYGVNLFRMVEKLLRTMTYRDAEFALRRDYGIRVPKTTINDWVRDEKIRNERRYKNGVSVDKRSEKHAKKKVPQRGRK